MNNDELLIVIKDMFEASVEKIEKKLDDKIEEVKRHTGALIENMHKDIKGVAEGHSVLDDKIDNLDEKADRLETRVDRFEKNMIVVKDYVIGLDAKLNEHETILKRVK